jgi:hypothetical protein
MRTLAFESKGELLQSGNATSNPDISPEAVIESAGRRVVIGV